ncbi:hypothetical protein IEQ34_015409 [Dendrobium chrysotoxum]|uniref:Uncharacterized protein n=1 Tax=Dendrobium chrysotoxum TaxID=161865 RepID=A0AAV7GHJ0_DENCH|nr:hypothetical protein IEQ34_015409 [Dendrobium chrysotoxum]
MDEMEFTEAESNIKPEMEFFLDVRVSNDSLAKLISVIPSILRRPSSNTSFYKMQLPAIGSATLIQADRRRLQVTTPRHQICNIHASGQKAYKSPNETSAPSHRICNTHISRQKASKIFQNRMLHSNDNTPARTLKGKNIIITRMGPGERVIGTHVTSRDAAQILITNPCLSFVKMDLQNTAFTVQLGCGVSIQLANAMITTENIRATLQFGSVDFPTVVLANDANSERPVRRLHPFGAPTCHAYLPT